MGSTTSQEPKSCSDFIRIFDDKILKPIFVYKYRYRKTQPEIDYEGVLKEVQDYEREVIHERSFVMSERSSSLIMHKTPKKTPKVHKTPGNNRDTSAVNRSSDIKDPSRELFRQFMESRNPRSRLVSVHQPVIMDMNFKVPGRSIKKMRGTDIEVSDDE